MISSLRLQQFRSYTDTSFHFGDGVNIIIGPNGSGKTNLLEAILVVAHGSSYRVTDAELLQFGATWFRLDAHMRPNNDLRTVKLVSQPRLLKTYELDDRVFRRLTERHRLPTVLFEPNHLQLLHGSPELRRNYLDDILEQTNEGYGGFRRNYRRVLAQRNALLKRSTLPSMQDIFPWNLRLSELGATVARARARLCEQLNEKLGVVYSDISDSTTKVEVAYRPKFSLENYETHLLEKLESHMHDDILRGFTSYGPHREDLVVLFDGHPANETASRGETRTAVLALKIIELQLIEDTSEQTPLLLLDDVFSELDDRRRTALTGFLSRYQTFLTTTDADMLVSRMPKGTVISLDNDQALTSR